MDGGVEADAMGALDKVAAMGAVEGVAACETGPPDMRVRRISDQEVTRIRSCRAGCVGGGYLVHE